TRSGQTEIPHSNPGETHIDHTPSQLTPEEDSLNALRQDDETHRPTDHTQRYPQADPPQKVTGADEFGAIKQDHHSWCEGKGRDHARPGKQQPYLGLFVHHAVTSGIFIGTARKTGIKVRPHSLQDEADI